ncbi:MAG: hypothetical protein R3F56_25610 [Planctomycetota bacterium]
MSRARTQTAAILRNELRMFWRMGRRGAARRALGGLGFVLALAFMHAPTFFLVMSFTQRGDGRGGPESAALFVLLFLFILGLQRSLEVLYNRGDLPFLLASPVPVRVVLLTRLLTITATTLLGSGPIVVALVDAGWILVDPRWAWGFVAWVACVGTIAPLTLMITLVTVRWLGARRARTAIQVLGLLFGIGVMLLMQAPQWAAGSSPAARVAARVSFAVHFEVAPLTHLAAAARGDVRGLATLVLVAAAALALARLALARAFVLGAQSAAGDVGNGMRRATGDTRRAWRRAFTAGRASRILRKEVRVLWRDPLLIARCSMQIVALLPMLIGTLMVRQTAGIAGLAFLAPSMVAVTLAALMNANDDAHEFVAASPMSRRSMALARAAAAASPTILLGLAVSAFLAWRAGPLLAALTALGATALSLAMGWLTTCTTPVLTAEERARQRPPRMLGQSMAGMVLGGLATGGIGALDADAIVAGVVLFASAMALAALLFLFQPRRFGNH